MFMPDVVKALVLLFEKEGVRLIALYGFGSLFRGEANAASDLDLGYLAEGRMSPERRWALQEDLARMLKRNVDLVDLVGASLVMKMQIVSRGTRLYCADASTCDRFETYVYSAYFRFNEERKEIVRDVMERGHVYER